MKLLMITALVLGLVSVTASAQNKAELKTQMDSVSYSIGQDIAQRLKQQQLDVNAEALAQGLKDAMSGQSSCGSHGVSVTIVPSGKFSCRSCSGWGSACVGPSSPVFNPACPHTIMNGRYGPGSIDCLA